MFKNFSPITDLENLKNTLETHGVAVLPNVFKDEECEAIKKSVFSYLSKYHSIETAEDLRQLSPISGGILHYYGVTLTKEVFDVKTDERVIEPFRRIWGEDDLTMSMDGMNIVPPPQQTFLGNATGFHTDQGNHRNSLACVQSFINFEHTENGDGCLSVLRYSHIHHHDFFDFFNIDTRGRDWYLLNKTFHVDWFLKRGCEWNKICAPKGSMIFWDSRTIHCATLPTLDRPNPDRWRFLIYACYTPARLQTPEDTKKKRNAYMNNQCTSHWPYGVKVFEKAKNDYKTNSLNELTERHKKFLGFHH